MKLSVYSILNNEYAIFHNEGLNVYSILEEKIRRKEKTELSFENISRCSSQFLNACIGKLYLLNNKNDMDFLLSFSDTNPLLDLKITEVIDNAIHSKDYDSLIDNALC